MKTEQRCWNATRGWKMRRQALDAQEVQLVFAFGSTEILKEGSRFQEIRGFYPKACIVGCSTAGEICDITVTDESLAVTAVHLEHTTFECFSETIEDGNSALVGKRLADQLPKDGLRHVFVLSDGLQVNGSDLVRGLAEHLPDEVTITGGLAGDGARFHETFVLGNAPAKKGTVTAVAFYGDTIRIGHGSFGGWDPFGPERLITRSEGNILYEMDGTSALELYKRYLGEYSSGLPATGLLFPISIRERNSTISYVRTILSVDEKQGSLTFAGDVPSGSTARLMRSNFNRLIDGAVRAAKAGFETIGSERPELAILISCVGRKLVLKQRVEEEVEGVREILGKECALTGFYSYGEISPAIPGIPCGLHNQTMTITTFREE